MQYRFGAIDLVQYRFGAIDLELGAYQVAYQYQVDIAPSRYCTKLIRTRMILVKIQKKLRKNNASTANFMEEGKSYCHLQVFPQSIQSVLKYQRLFKKCVDGADPIFWIPPCRAYINIYQCKFKFIMVF